ncbi:MAG TPA: glycosyltransferase family 39 protein [Acidimicrobiales bacterium]|nr:glycosyltransferase family 39 protein [Acidimicrobiales bacterium]
MRGPAGDPVWARPALLLLLAVTAGLYLWDLGASGWANSFYSAAVQAGTRSWRAFFFGSSDSSNFITVDKPPAALWVMEISARIFGLSSWSILVPQALEGVAAVAVLYAAVRRWASAGAGLMAAAVMAFTPVAALMFRFNNPDALLVLLLTGAAYATTVAIEKSSTRWLIFAFSLVGFGFITKMMQAFLVVPAMAAAYFLAAPAPVWRRVRQLAAAGVAMVVSAGWWVAAVMLTPAADRPYIGGSQDNNLLNLIFGYNGFGRLTGNESGSVVAGGATGTSGQWGPTGLTRLFGSEMGSQISWLLPAALVLLVAVLVATWRRPRTSRTRASMVLWGGWLLVTGLVFSLAQGIIHPYYTVALAPAIGAVVGTGTWFLWSRRSVLWARLVLGSVVVVSSIWAAVLLDRVPAWHPWLRTAILVAGCAAGVLLVLSPDVPRYWERGLAARPYRVAGRTVVVGLACVAVLAGPFAYTLATAATPHSGAIPTAGPASAGLAGFPGGGGFAPGRTGGRGGPGRAGATFPSAGGPGSGTGGSGTGGSGTGGSGPGGSGPGGFGPGGSTGATGRRTGQLFPGAGAPPGSRGARSGGTGGGGAGAGFAPTGTNGQAGNGGGLGGLLNSSTADAAITDALKADASRYTWVAAVVGSNEAAGYQLAAREPVMAIGGFNGTDPAPTLAEFEQYVKERKIHYFISSGASSGGAGFGGPSAAGSDDASLITAWVEDHFTATTVGGVTVYNLTAAEK